MNKVKLTAAQDEAMTVARVGMMNQCPFLAYYFYSEMVEHPTTDFPTAATDGRRIFYNIDYLMALTAPERIFVMAHEVFHAIMSHPTRIKHYGSAGSVRNLPWDGALFNIAMDLAINHELVAQGIGVCNQSWCYDPNTDPNDLPEDIYEKLYKKKPPQPNSGSGKSGSSGSPTSGLPKYGDKKSHGKPDKQASDGRFDEVLPPQVDQVTGAEDLPGEAEFKEAIARAAAAAKAMGKMPASFQKIVDEILEPQVSWREHIRMLVTGRVGARHETWDRPNRRRLALARGDVNKMVILPGRRGYGAQDVVVVLDSSGSIYADEKALASFFAEIGGIMADVNPKNLYVIHCDRKVQRVDVVRSMFEVEDVRVQGTVGGGGTDFRPPFEWLKENNVKPECLVYLTDMYGTFPSEAPAYPVIWCATTDEAAPFGEIVRITA